MTRARSIAPLFILLLFFLMTSFSCKAQMTGKISEPCEGQKDSVVVDTSSHMLWICRDNKKIRDFGVSLGRGGTCKKTQGDNKTPLGEYFLGMPHPSKRFGIFIPIGYPTEEQKSKGFSGGDVGLHGPSRPFKRLCRLDTTCDWTQGCIAVGTDKEILEIAQWVKDQNVNRIVLK